MKRLTFFPIFFILMIFAGYYLFPFYLTKDMAVSTTYSKKFRPNTNDLIFPSLVRYASDSSEFLKTMNEKELLGIRCSDSFIRTNQSAYILKNEKTSQRYKRTVKDTKFIEFMRDKEETLPIGKKILTARVCETETKNLLLLYTIGKYDSKNVDNSTIVQTLVNSTENEALLEIFPKGQKIGSYRIKVAESTNHILCDEPFQISKDNKLYLLCSEEKNKTFNGYIYEVDLTKKEVKIKSKCLNDFTSELKTTCS